MPAGSSAEHQPGPPVRVCAIDGETWPCAHARSNRGVEPPELPQCTGCRHSVIWHAVIWRDRRGVCKIRSCECERYAAPV